MRASLFLRLSALSFIAVCLPFGVHAQSARQAGSSGNGMVAAAQPPAPEWGAMLGAERNQIFSAPHLVFFPGLAIMITVLGFNLLGDGLRDVLDPKSSGR